jgi:hypothetical protein
MAKKEWIRLREKMYKDRTPMWESKKYGSDAGLITLTKFHKSKKTPHDWIVEAESGALHQIKRITGKKPAKEFIKSFIIKHRPHFYRHY